MQQKYLTKSYKIAYLGGNAGGYLWGDAWGYLGGESRGEPYWAHDGGIIVTVCTVTFCNMIPQISDRNVCSLTGMLTSDQPLKLVMNGIFTLFMHKIFNLNSPQWLKLHEKVNQTIRLGLESDSKQPKLS